MGSFTFSRHTLVTSGWSRTTTSPFSGVCALRQDHYAKIEEPVISLEKLAVLCKQGKVKEVLNQLEENDNFRLDYPSYACLLNACNNEKSLFDGKRIHVQIAKNGLECNRFLGNLLVNMYGKCGSLREAGVVFSKIYEPNVFSWTTLISMYAEHGLYKNVFQLFRLMQMEDVQPDKFTFTITLNACSSPSDLAEGKLFHAGIIEYGFEVDVVAKTALITMYGKCGRLEDARRIFDGNGMTEEDIVLWNAMITAYAHCGHVKEALILFQRMQLCNLKPNKVSYVSILNACSTTSAISEGKLIHAHILDSTIESNVFVGTSLVGMYGKFSDLEHARVIFNKMVEINVVSWAVMISGYARYGDSKVAIDMFDEMQREYSKPNYVIFGSVLDASASLGAYGKGKWAHACTIHSRLQEEIVIATALINMYGKCGNVNDACQVFDKISNKDVLLWNTLMAVYAQHGDGQKAMQLLKDMWHESMKPDDVTFLSILSGCSHGGLLAEAWHCFVFMAGDLQIIPTVEHWGCMVDLLGRSGWLQEAQNCIKEMVIEPDVVLWITLLGACRNHGNLEQAKRVAEEIFLLDPGGTAQYVLLANIYGASGRWDDVTQLKRSTGQTGLHSGELDKV